MPQSSAWDPMYVIVSERFFSLDLYLYEVGHGNGRLAGSYCTDAHFFPKETF